MMNVRPNFEQRVSAGELSRRQAAVRARMKEMELDAFLVSADGPFYKLGHLRYLTNWSQPLFNEYYLMPQNGDGLFISRYAGRTGLLKNIMKVDCRYPEFGESYKNYMTAPSTRGGAISAEFVAREIEAAGLRRIGIAGPETMSGDFYVGFIEELERRGIHYETVSHVIDELRFIKSEEEQIWMRKSAENGSFGYEIFKGLISPGRREYEVWAQVVMAQQLAGAEQVFWTSAHGREKPVSRFIDMACDAFEVGDIVYFNAETVGPAGYNTQVVRTLVLGKADDNLRRAHDANVEAQLAGAAALKPGARMLDVYNAIAEVGHKRGYDTATNHLGHGQGLDIFEAPLVSRFDDTIIQAGMTITLHPSIASAPGGYARTGDTYLVTDKGGELLSTTSLELTEIL
jgi:Xaa-Pro aminopeptidase